MDIFRIFRTCFFCKGRIKLSQVVSPGYYEEFHYYHPQCLQEVMQSPEKYPEFVDTAIQIIDQISREKIREEEKQREINFKIARLRELRSRRERLNELSQQISEIHTGNLPPFSFQESDAYGKVISQNRIQAQTSNEPISTTEVQKNEEENNKLKNIFKS